MSDGKITRIASTLPGDNLVYSIMQNADKSTNTGFGLIFSKTSKKIFTFNLSANGYQNIIEAFTVDNLYPVKHSFIVEKQSLFSWNTKFNGNFLSPGLR